MRLNRSGENIIFSYDPKKTKQNQKTHDPGHWREEK